MAYNLLLYILPILNTISLFGWIIPKVLGNKVGHYKYIVIMTGVTAVVILAI
jgi:hypothetical protein